MREQPLALVLGATGGAGGEIAGRLAARGWRVRAMHRNAAPGLRDGLAWMTGDALVAADVARAAEGAQVIVHAVNPPGYRNWGATVLPMLDNTLAAARANGARIALPGSVYNFAPATFPNLTETTPQQVQTRKGRIRVEMERRLEAAAADGTPTLILRGGDFFGPRAGNNWFSQLVKPGHPVAAVTLPSAPGLSHPWAYLPDFAETMVRLLEETGGLGAFEVFHFAGHQVTGAQMAAAISRAAGRSVPVRAFPWLAAQAASPFVEMLREVVEMRYLWRLEHRLDNTKLIARLGAVPHTPLDQAVRETLVGLECLPAALARAA